MGCPSSGEGLAPVASLLQSLVGFIEPPAHTRVRAAIRKVVSPDVVERMRPRIQGLVETLLDRVQGAGEMELIADLARPLPMLVIGDLLGLPTEDSVCLKNWTGALAAFFGGEATMARSRDAMSAAVDLEAYFRHQLADRRARPRADALTCPAAAQQGGFLNEQELVSNCSGCSSPPPDYDAPHRKRRAGPAGEPGAARPPAAPSADDPKRD